MSEQQKSESTESPELQAECSIEERPLGTALSEACQMGTQLWYTFIGSDCLVLHSLADANDSLANNRLVPGGEAGGHCLPPLSRGEPYPCLWVPQGLKNGVNCEPLD